MDKIISVNNVTFEYETDDGVLAVIEDLSVNFEKGSFTAVLGHNGSGKSTLAKLLNGLNKPAKGDVIVSGMNTDDDDKAIDIKRIVGMVFQNPDNQLVSTVVDEDVAFGLENLGVEPHEMRRRVDEALKAVDMYEYKDSSPHKLSGGQKQRIAIAGIIAMEPECIVLDEPTAMLDPRGRQEVMETIIKLCREKGITIILITHYMNEAAMADRVVVMDNGKILLDGIPSKVFSQVELLQSVGLDVPQPTELIFELKKAGIDLDGSIITVDECVKALTQALREEI